MSISTLQEKFFNKGCGSALIVVAALAMGASLFTSSMGRNDDASRTGPNGQNETAVATVDGVPVFASEIERMADEQAKQLAGMGDLNASFRSFIQGQAINSSLQTAAAKAILAKGEVTDAEVLAAAKSAIGADVERARAKFVSEGKLKPDATDAQLQTALKDALGGRTLAQLRGDLPKQILARFKDGTTRAAVLDQFGSAILASRLGERAVASDADLRDAYKTYVLRRIFLSVASGSKETPEVRAQKALTDLNAGKSFASVMDAYSNDPAPSGKKPHDATQSVASSVLNGSPEYAALKGKAAPARTGIVDVPGGKAIYEIVSVDANLPKEFDRDKAKLRVEKAREIGQAEVDRQVRALLASDAVKWSSPGYHALAALSGNPGDSSSAEARSSSSAMELAKTALASKSPAERRLGALAYLSATNDTGSPEAIKDRKAAIEAALANGIDDATLGIQLADLYGKEKNGAKATDALISASKANDRYDTGGQRVFGDIAAKALELNKASVITAAQLKEIQAQQALWTAAKTDDSKAAAGAKLTDDELKKENDAEIQRQMAEAAKTAPPATTPAPAKGGSMLPTTTGTGG